jgi:hypothetical protein
VNYLKHLAVILAILFWACTASANLITNGDFETVSSIAPLSGTGGAQVSLDALKQGQWSIYESLPSWTSTNTSLGIEVQYGLSSVQSGNDSRYVELDTTANSGMVQTISGLLSGTTYELSFQYFSRTGDASSAINVLLGGTSLLTAYYDQKIWTTFSETFVYDGESTAQFALSFLADGSSNSLGGLIDNVSLRAVPIPGAAVLLGSALLGLVGLRRTRLV